jgi:hypothetical protein
MAELAHKTGAGDALSRGGGKTPTGPGAPPSTFAVGHALDTLATTGGRTVRESCHMWIALILRRSISAGHASLDSAAFKLCEADNRRWPRCIRPRLAAHQVEYSEGF